VVESDAGVKREQFFQFMYIYQPGKKYHNFKLKSPILICNLLISVAVKKTLNVFSFMMLSFENFRSRLTD
jgi:hypothetical protein